MADIPSPRHLEACFFTDEIPIVPPRRFGIVTACNPFDVLAAPEQNAAANALLENALAADRRTYFRVAGGSRDRSLLEPGFAVLADSPEDIRAYSRRFAQKAFYWVEQSEIFLINTDGEILHPVDTWDARLIA